MSRAVTQVIRWGSVGLMLLLWDMVVRLGWIDKLFLAPPYLTLLSLPRSWGMALPHMKVTLLEFGLGFLIAAYLGISLGLVIGIVRYLEQLPTEWVKLSWKSS